MKDFQPVAERIGENDQVLHAALVRECTRAACDLDAGLLQPRREAIERGRVGDFPAVESNALSAIFGDEQALLAVVHAQR